MIVADYDWKPEHTRFKFQERASLATKLAAAEQAAQLCPKVTASGAPCKGKRTDTGYCMAHSKAGLGAEPSASAEAR